MPIKWFWRSSTGQRPAEPVDLTVAAADANAGGSLYDIASCLVRLAVHRAEPDEALRVLSSARPPTWLRLDVQLRNWRHSFCTDNEWRQITDPARTESDPLALLLTACAGDGLLRQRAVVTPLMRSDQRLLPILLATNRRVRRSPVPPISTGGLGIVTGRGLPTGYSSSKCSP
jgi:hypothetical protein